MREKNPRGAAAPYFPRLWVRAGVSVNTFSRVKA